MRDDIPLNAPMPSTGPDAAWPQTRGLAMAVPSNPPAAPDPMRQSYRKLSLAEQYSVQRFKDVGMEFYDELDIHGASRELSIAKTKIEEAVMWAVKHVTK